MVDVCPAYVYAREGYHIPPQDLCRINIVAALVGNRFVSLKATRGTVARVRDMWVTIGHPVVVRRCRTGIYF